MLGEIDAKSADVDLLVWLMTRLIQPRTLVSGSFVSANNDSRDDLVMHCLDLVVLILSRFGVAGSLVSYFSGNTSASSKDGGKAAKKLITEWIEWLLQLLVHNRSGLRKKASLALGHLAALLVLIDDSASNKEFEALAQFFNQHLALKNSNSKKGQVSLEVFKSMIACLGWVMQCCADVNVNKFKSHLPTLFAHILTCAQSHIRTDAAQGEVEDNPEEDELVESCTQVMEVMMQRYPEDLSGDLPQVTQMCLRFVKYDPNYFDDESDDFLTKDAPTRNGVDEDASMAGSDAVGDDDEFYDDEDEGAYTDDEDMSWKVRRQSAKLLTTMVQVYAAPISSSLAAASTSGSEASTAFLTDFLRNVFGEVTRRLVKEREEGVRLEIAQCILTLLKFSYIIVDAEEAAKPSVSSAVETPPGSNAVSPASPVTRRSSRKRKKSSSAATRAVSAKEMMETDDHASTTHELIRALDVQSPALCRALSVALDRHAKSLATRQVCFHILKQLVLGLGLTSQIQPQAHDQSQVRSGSFMEKEMSRFLQALEMCLVVASPVSKKNGGTNSNLMMDSLAFISAAVRSTGSTSWNSNALATQTGLEMAQLVLKCVTAEKFYKVVAEGLTVLSGIIKNARSFDTPGASIEPVAQQMITGVYEGVLPIAIASDSDTEVKQAAIECIASIVFVGADILPKDAVQSKVLPLMLERMKIESTRLIVVQKLAMILESPVASTKGSIELNGDLLQHILDEVLGYLKQNQRGLRVASLGLSDALITRYATSIKPQVFSALVADIVALLSDDDLQVLSMSLAVMTSLLSQIKLHQHVRPLVFPVLKSSFIPALVHFVGSAGILANSGKSLTNVLVLFETWIQTEPSDYPDFETRFVQSVNKFGSDATLSQMRASAGQVATGIKSGSGPMTTDVLGVMAQCWAAMLSQVSPAQFQKSVRQLGSTIASYVKNQSSDVSELMVYLALMTVGEVGRRGTDLSRAEFDPQVVEVMLRLIAMPTVSEDARMGASVALGRVAVGNPVKFLPLIVENLKLAATGGDVKRHYYLLCALNQAITQYSKHESQSADLLAQYAGELWNLLFEQTQPDDAGVVAECLGRLALTNPTVYLPDLQSRLKSGQVTMRTMVISAVKYTLCESKEESFDDLLRPLIPEFLSLMSSDADLNVRRMALSGLHTALHNKPVLIRDHLSTLLPLVIQETRVREELIKIVDMGPFKHKVDEGLDVRKTAFECLHSLLNVPMLITRVDPATFVQEIVQAFKDPASEIQALGHLMLIKVCTTVSPLMSQSLISQLLQTKTLLDGLVEASRAIIFLKLKDSAVKQEIEKASEMTRSTLRALITLAFSLGVGVGVVVSNPPVIKVNVAVTEEKVAVLMQLIKEVQANQQLQRQFQVLVQELMDEAK